MKIEFTTTACSRPDVIDETYRSFMVNMKDIEFKESTLYLNVDPLPSGRDCMEVVEVAKKYFGNVVYNIPKKGNLTNAVKWTWGQLKGDYNFYLQDDWSLFGVVSMKELVQRIERQNNPKCISITLRAYVKKSNRIVLAPSLFSSDFCRKKAVLLNNKYSTERQLWYSSKNRCILEKGFYALRYPEDNLIIKDIGRDWLKKQGYKKESSGINFKTWRKRDEKR